MGISFEERKKDIIKRHNFDKRKGVDLEELVRKNRSHFRIYDVERETKILIRGSKKDE